MLSIKDLRYYCRTCLVKLELSHEENVLKFVPTNKHSELERLINACLAKTTAGGDSLSFYAPYLCRSCFDKWFEFLKLYQLAVKADGKLREILEKEVLKTESKKNDNAKTHKDNEMLIEHFVDAEILSDAQEVEKYETTSPFYTDIQINSPVSNVQQSSSIKDTSEYKSEVTKTLKTIEIVTDDFDNFCSDTFSEVGYTSESAENVTLEKPKKFSKANKISTKTCSFKKTYETRKSLLKNLDVQLSEIAKDSIVSFRENDTKKVRYQCESCNKYFWEKNKYEGHIKQVHEGIKRPYQCPQCDKSYNLYKTLLQHQREYHSEKSQEIFKCDKCNKTFKTSVILKQHLNNKHSAQKEAMRSICDQCGFIAAHQYSLARHIINKHTETDQIKCEQCPKVFKTQYSLKYHIIGNHNPMNIKPFKCPECQMGFTRKTLLNQHKRTHLKYTERIKCDFEGCEVRFVKHGDKTHHMRLVHLKVKQHICDFCGEAFGAMQTLRHHRYIHTGEKPYKCNVCGQGFRQRTAMKTHRKTHFGKNSERQDSLNNLPELNLSLVNTLNT